MNHLKVLLSGILLLVLAQSCKKMVGTGPVISEERNLSGFNEVASELAGDVQITTDSTFSIILEGQQNILDVLETDISPSGRLHIRIKNGVMVSGKDIKVRISMPDISGLYLSGSGDMEVLNQLQTSDLDLHVKGSGNISLNRLFAHTLTAKISGSGEINIGGGEVQSESLTISGSGAMDLLQVESEEATVKSSGSGSIQLFVTERLNVKISGSGNVYYRGNPVIDVDISGSGSLKRL